MVHNSGHTRKVMIVFKNYVQNRKFRNPVISQSLPPKNEPIRQNSNNIDGWNMQ